MNYDKYLVRIRDGDQDAFRVLMRECYEPLISFVHYIVGNRESAEEIVQDVFVNVWVSRSKISFDTPIKNYLYVSARNLAFNHLRNSKRLKARIEKLIPREDIIIEAFMIEKDAIDLLENAIDRLPPRTAEIIKMSLQGMKREEIARILGTTESNIKNLKALGIKKLRVILGDIQE